MNANIVRRVEPVAIDLMHSEWSGGAFDMGRRPYTPVVEGVLSGPQHLLMATIGGGADSLRVRASCGHRFDGPEYVGAVSIVPANCERQLRLLGVQSKWASLAIDADQCNAIIVPGSLTHCVSNVRDVFLFGMLAEMARLRARDGSLDPLYCEAMTQSAAYYLARRHAGARELRTPYRFTRWQMNLLEAYIEEHLSGLLRIADLAALVDCSIPHFHRAFRGSCHMTPLDYINHRRIQRAKHLLGAKNPVSVATAADLVGFGSVNHFTRLFRRLAGTTPGRFRKQSG
jgi:AraC-like DNA-binding protein